MVRGPVLLDRIFALNTLAINAMVMGLVFLSGAFFFRDEKTQHYQAIEKK
jgi:multisubunit Na+/H+ antiporter MnhF subunit